MGVSAFLLPSSLNIAIGQRLVRRLCDQCKKEEKEVPLRIRDIIEKELAKIPEATKTEYAPILEKGIKIWHAPGCKFCAGKGTKGRIAIYEVMFMNSQIEKIIIEGPTESKIVEETVVQGMITMKQDGFLKVLAGLISVEEAMEAVED
ncbi:MAG: hypothetical protein A2174_03135 [Candidatus Portnoybacteria bacterium RBG_13_41_18]|uniref:Bacterial type II secretion system protein E domain-containing protein n=1 Tax=Candidatus Portnoybacteria bacterium RBG_13_41_18 TaxID=1801991 RepID=A0A1G2FA60_9BACT|nr:MAG: hypothetical protein A2174_03135 [Candidatus Portnoybacteria bacterium RBG_13_41_18]